MPTKNKASQDCFKIAVLLTSHNRIESTLVCLNNIFTQELPNNINIKVFLVDDGSTDGTGKNVSNIFPQVNVIYGGGNLYWNGGMRIAFSEAIKLKFDFYIWLNDDTNLFKYAISHLLFTFNDATFHNGTKVIVVGSTIDPISNELSYGGCITNSKINPASCIKKKPELVPIQCDSFNGNIVLMHKSVVEVVGNLDKRFTHALGDLDFGFRAKKLGCSLWIAPGYLGECKINTSNETWTDKSLPWNVRIYKMLGPKGIPPKEWLIFTSRHSGFLWPIYFINPYIKIILDGFIKLFNK